MALDKATLKTGIKTLAQTIAESAGTYDDFADGLANLIDAYVKTATVTIAAGIAVATAGSATAQTGTTTSTGIGTLS
ncbi:MAG: hypothetical protein WCR72_14670 [Bacteroidota bacterium]